MTIFLKYFYSLCLICCISISAFTQSKLQDRLTYSLAITFPAYGLPFKKINDNFKNTGGALGVDYSLNKIGNLFQGVSIGILNHSEHGNAFYLNTQFSYRPKAFKVLEPNISLGVGRLISFANHKNATYEITDGTWKKSTNQSQAHWQVPLTLGLGYHIKFLNHGTITPLIGYEITPIIKYNSALPILPYSLLKGGIRYTISNIHNK